jgi:hypothetical protein
MKKREIHAWAAAVCDRVKSGVTNEDSQVEFKADWPDPKRAARRIGAHANSMHSEPILWLVGVDEKNGVIGLSTSRDPGAWYEECRSVFDGVAPDLGGAVSFEYEGKQVAAIQFDTDAAPYVVKNASGQGPFQSEVPWRDGTLTRSAHQREILQILLPAQRLPVFEVLEATVWADGTGTNSSAEWKLEIIAFAEPATREPVTIPFHRMEVVIQRADNGENALTLDVQMQPVAEYQLLDPARIWATPSEAVLGCPGRVRIFARGFEVLEITPVDPSAPKRVIVRVLPTHAEFPRVFDVTVLPVSDRGSQLGRWVYPSYRVDQPRSKDWSFGSVSEPRFSSIPRTGV